MFITDISNTKKLHSAVIQELRSYGIKYRVKKSHKNVQGSGGVLFGAPLHIVPQQTVVCCGTTLQVPVLVHEACCFLRTSVHFEGLFRKAGSQMRQRDIKRLLETGCKIDKSYHAIDIAGILKLYLRSLPEPVLGSNMQEVLLRCLIMSDNLVLNAVQSALLLLPTPYLDILHYIMEFFRYVSSKSEVNKMDTNNLAIVLAPSVIPLPPSYSPQRMEQHVKLMKVLIENAGMIGRVPHSVLKYLDDDVEREEDKIKKKRRSGSLTRMLNGLRKMVSGNNQVKATTPDFLATPVLDKCSGKRKQDEHLGLSAKKRKEILSALPQHPLCTPIRSLGEKEYKKLRLSIGRKPKDKPIEYKTVSTRDISSCVPKDSILNKSLEDKKCTIPNELNSDLNKYKDDFVTISKSEYESIKQRVSAIENRLSQEFNVITAIDPSHNMEPVKQVQSAYEKTCQEVASLASPNTEHLAKRLSRELKIRRSDEHKIMRSPSARKIGVIRRKSRENITKLTRTNTWTVSTYTGIVADHSINQFSSQVNLRRGKPNTINTGLMHPTSVVNSHLTPQIKPRMSLNDDMARDISASNMSAHSYLTRHQIKRSSYHGDGENKSPLTSKDKKANSSNESGWKSAKSFLSSVENIENHQTGRASVAKLRSQNAGMVLAKAKLFDGMTDSDTSIEKKIVSKPIRHTGFARKPRKNINDSQNKLGLNSTDETDISSSINDKTMRRPRSRTTRSPVKSLTLKDNLKLSNQLKDVIYDVCTPLSEKVGIDKTQTPTARMNVRLNANSRTPRNSTPVKKAIGVRNNRSLTQIKNIKSTTLDAKRVLSTPLRTNQGTPRRQSPRPTSIKSRYN